MVFLRVRRYCCLAVDLEAAASQDEGTDLSFNLEPSER